MIVARILTRALLGTLALVLALAPAAHATRLARVRLGPSHTVEQLLESGFDVVSVKHDAWVDVLLQPGDFERLERQGATPEILEQDVERHATERAATELSMRPRPMPHQVRAAVRPDGVYRIESLPPFGAGSMGGFWTLDEVKMKLDELVANDTHNVVADKIDTIGSTVQGRPIWGLKLGRSVAMPDTRPVVFLTALAHAREPEGMQALLYFVDDLLSKADVDPFATSLLDQRVIYIVPVGNPDGYRFNQTIAPGGGGIHRKNLRDTNNNGLPDYPAGNGGDGVDLNRNFSFKWGLNNTGSSGTPGTFTYRGPSAFSEPETQAIRDLAITLQPRTGISFHTYSELFLHPWGWTAAATPDSMAFYEWNDEAMAGNPSTSGASPRVLYAVNGEFNDWMYGDTLVKPRGYTWTPEIGFDADGFWPAPSRIEPLARENLRTCYTVAAIAGPYVRAEAATVIEGNLLRGQAAHLAVRARNRGLAATPPGLAATLVALDAGTSVMTGALPYPTLAPLTSGNASGDETFVIQAADTFTVGRVARFEVQFSAPGGYYSRDTVSIVVGLSTVLLIEPANDVALWNASSGWGVVSNDVAHPSRYFADSPAGFYPANTDRPLTYNGQFNLSPGVHAYALFEARWALEPGYDGTFVETSLDGVTWTPMAGGATQPGVFPPQQPGNPIYHGTRWLWKPERVDLSPLTGPSAGAVRFRFRTVSDTGKEFDGFHLDSLRVLLYDPAAQPAPAPAAVGDAPGVALELGVPEPNPARARARLSFGVPFEGPVRLEVLDLQGRRVRLLADGPHTARRYALAWDLKDDAGRAVAPGIYFARLSGAAGSLTRRLVVLR